MNESEKKRTSVSKYPSFTCSENREPKQVLFTDQKDGRDIFIQSNHTLSRYGLREMKIQYGSEIDIKEKKQPSYKEAKSKIMSAKDSKAPSVNIKCIGDYELIKTIGSGASAKVKLAIHKQTHQKVAVKIVPRKDLAKKKETLESQERRILREAAIMNLIDHKNIVHLVDFLITDQYFCLFFEYVDGTHVLDYIIDNNGRLEEKEAQRIFRQILSAVDYCHNNSIVHRDLKIENIMIDKEGTVKLLDFGLSNFYDPHGHLDTFCGSLYFAAAELLDSYKYMGPEIDMWSLGVVLYVLTQGKMPFNDKSVRALHAKIKACQYDFPHNVSEECKSLIRRLICRDIKQRASMDETLLSKWVNKGYSEVPAYLIKERLPIEDVDPDIVEYLSTEFNIQFTAEQIQECLELAKKDFKNVFKHPVISLYFLASEKLFKGQADAKFTVMKGQRSKSYACLPSLKEPASAKLCAENTSTRYGKLSDPVRIRSMSLDTGMSTASPMSKAQISAIRTVYFRGLLSGGLMLTTNQDPSTIRTTILECLPKKGLSVEDQITTFNCKYCPSIIHSRAHSMETEDLYHYQSTIKQVDHIVFQIHIVKVAFTNQYGLQFKKISGRPREYRNICKLLLSELDL